MGGGSSRGQTSPKIKSGRNHGQNRAPDELEKAARRLESLASEAQRRRSSAPSEQVAMATLRYNTTPGTAAAPSMHEMLPSLRSSSGPMPN